MITVIWILKGILALLFALVGFTKLISTKEKLLAKGMKGLAQLEPNRIKTIGILEIAGAVGLILPSLLNLYPGLSGVAALCFAFMMVVAAVIHRQLKLPILPNIVLIAMCLVIVYWEFFK